VLVVDQNTSMLHIRTSSRARETPDHLTEDDRIQVARRAFERHRQPNHKSQRVFIFFFVFFLFLIFDRRKQKRYNDTNRPNQLHGNANLKNPSLQLFKKPGMIPPHLGIEGVPIPRRKSRWSGVDFVEGARRRQRSPCRSLDEKIGLNAATDQA
jgi:hypothetical protein